MNETSVLSIGAFYGDTLSRTFAGAVFSDVVHEHARAVPEHRHEAPYFCLLVNGAYWERAGTVEIDYRPMTLTYHPAGTTHCDRIGADGAQFFMIELGESWLPSIAALGASDERLTELHDSDALWLALRLRGIVANDDGDTEFIASGLLHELSGHSVRPDPLTGPEPPWLAAIDSTLRERFNHGLDIATIAETVAIHPAHLTRAYRRFRGRTIGAHIAHLRLQDACRRLAETDDSVSDVAAASGFADQSHLTRSLVARAARHPLVIGARYVPEGGSP